MTPSRPPDQLDVPIERLAAGRGQARRAGAVAAAIVLVVGGAFALARWTETRSSATQPSGSSGPRTVDVRRSIPAPSAARRSTPPRVEALPDVRSVALPGAPEVTFVERTGPQLQDLRILVWTPDDGRTRTIRAFNGAAADEPADESIFPVVSPDRHGLVILSGGGSSGGEARLLNDDGRRLWSGDGIAVESGALWSADSRLVVLAGRPRRWQIVRLDRPGHATAKTVTLPFEVYTPKPLPNGWLTFPTDDPRTVPIGFSADGRWIYGGVVSAQLGILVAVFRVASDGSSVEHLTDFRVGTPDGLVPRPGTIGVRIVDPGTGRVVNERANIDVTGGPRTVECAIPMRVSPSRSTRRRATARSGPTTAGSWFSVPTRCSSPTRSSCGRSGRTAGTASPCLPRGRSPAAS